MFRIDRTRVNVHSSENEPKSQQALSEITVPAETAGGGQQQEASMVPADVREDITNRIIAEANAAAEEIRRAAEAQQKAAELDRLAAEDERRAAEKLLLDAKTEAERLFEESRIKGYEEGQSRAQRELDELTSENGEALNRLFAEVRAKILENFENVEAEIIDLCFATVRKIANLDRTKDGELFKAAIKKTLKSMDLSGSFSIRLSGEDYNRFFPEGEYVFDLGDGQVKAALAADEKLSGGDIVIDTETEVITAGIESQLKCIEIAFNQQLGRKNEEN